MNEEYDVSEIMITVLPIHNLRHSEKKGKFRFEQTFVLRTSFYYWRNEFLE